MSLKKQFLKSGDTCKVTFRLSKTEANDAKKVNLVGSFNNWDINSDEMTPLKSGDFTLVVTLPINQDIEYRYLLDGNEWINDPEADAYCSNGQGENNSVVKTTI